MTWLVGLLTMAGFYLGALSSGFLVGLCTAILVFLAACVGLIDGTSNR